MTWPHNACANCSPLESHPGNSDTMADSVSRLKSFGDYAFIVKAPSFWHRLPVHVGKVNMEYANH